MVVVIARGEDHLWWLKARGECELTSEINEWQGMCLRWKVHERRGLRARGGSLASCSRGDLKSVSLLLDLVQVCEFDYGGGLWLCARRRGADVDLLSTFHNFCPLVVVYQGVCVEECKKYWNRDRTRGGHTQSHCGLANQIPAPRHQTKVNV